MNANRILCPSVLLAASLSIVAPSYASGPFDVTGTTVLTESGQNVAIRKGLNLIDPETQMDCVSAAGCSIIIQSKVYFLDTQKGNSEESYWCMSALIDGSEAQPPCQKNYHQGVVEDTLLQTLDVAQGTHTVQTGLKVRANKGQVYHGTLYSWIITYTMYDH